LNFIMGIFDRFFGKAKDEPAKDPAAAEAPPTPPQSEPADEAIDPPVHEKAAGDQAALSPSPPSARSVPPPVASRASSPAPPAKKGWFESFRDGLRKTAQLLNTDIRDLFKREGRLVDDAFLDELYAILVRTDMGAGPAGDIRHQVAADFRARIVHMEDVLAVVKAKFRELLAQPEVPIKFADQGPTVVMVVGVNGSGKTTSIAKLASMFRGQGKRVVVGAGDTFRAAAVEQLAIWAERVGAEIVRGEPGGDPASVAHRAAARAVESGAEVCIIDTAGRLQTQSHLMQQLEKIYRVVGKVVPGAPHETLLVLDATAGQNGISQAKGFSEAARCTGIVLAKLDGTAKGGVVIPIRQQFGIPVKFVGVGEKAGDLAPFQADSFVDALFAETRTAARAG
jgi:fused signal recognition particle receptor